MRVQNIIKDFQGNIFFLFCSYYYYSLSAMGTIGLGFSFQTNLMSFRAKAKLTDNEIPLICVSGVPFPHCLRDERPSIQEEKRE